MGEITNQIAIVLGVLVACFAGPAAALFVLIRRKSKARQSRRSPIGIALLRGPGHSLREQLDEAHNDPTWDLVLLMVVPLLALALFLAQSHLRGLPQTAHLAPVYALAAIAFIATMLRKLLKAGTRLVPKARRGPPVTPGKDDSKKKGTDHPFGQPIPNISVTDLATSGGFPRP